MLKPRLEEVLFRVRIWVRSRDLCVDSYVYSDRAKDKACQPMVFSLKPYNKKKTKKG